MENFKTHGYYTISNSGGYEVEIANSNDAIRVREAWGGDNPKVSDWLEITYKFNEDTDEYDAVANYDGEIIPLNLVIRV